MERTKIRPLVTVLFSSFEAIAIFVILSLIALCLVVLFLNKLTLMFSLVAIALAASYPFTKRLHYLPQVHLGLAFAWAVPMAFVAITDTYTPKWGWLLFIATISWTTAYDTMYSMVARNDDINIDVKSTEILSGSSDRIIIGVLQSSVLFALMSVGSLGDLRYGFLCS